MCNLLRAAWPSARAAVLGVQTAAQENSLYILHTNPAPMRYQSHGFGVSGTGHARPLPLPLRSLHPPTRRRAVRWGSSGSVYTTAVGCVQPRPSRPGAIPFAGARTRRVHTYAPGQFSPPPHSAGVRLQRSADEPAAVGPPHAAGPRCPQTPLRTPLLRTTWRSWKRASSLPCRRSPSRV